MKYKTLPNFEIVKVAVCNCTTLTLLWKIKLLSLLIISHQFICLLIAGLSEYWEHATVHSILQSPYQNT